MALRSKKQLRSVTHVLNALIQRVQQDGTGGEKGLKQLCKLAEHKITSNESEMKNLKFLHISVFHRYQYELVAQSLNKKKVTASRWHS